MKNHRAKVHEIYKKRNNSDLITDRVVNSFHNWGLNAEDLAEDMIADRFSGDGTIEAASHKTLPWRGIMWHPERTFDGVDLDPSVINTLMELAE